MLVIFHFEEHLGIRSGFALWILDMETIPHEFSASLPKPSSFFKTFGQMFQNQNHDLGLWILGVSEINSDLH